jgi:hypothetical protein
MKHQPPPAADPEAGDPLADYQPVALGRARHDGWTAERQRTFLAALAETGCISEACLAAGITARSAYRLRAHPQGERFAQGWDQALRYATSKLLTLAYERAVRGSVREMWRDGRLIAEARQPSDKLLMYLLSNLAPWNAEPTTRWARLDATAGQGAAALAPLLETLTDNAEVAADELSAIDFGGNPPVRAEGETPRDPFDEDEAW